ncbi:MAG: pirin family protein, partial [Limnohabitans sp.]
TPPGYQAILDAEIPRVALDGGAGEVRVMAGTFAQATGAARTFSPMQVLDLHLKAGHKVSLPVQEGWNTALVLLDGEIRVADEDAAGPAQLVVLSREGDALALEARTDVKALLLSGQPLNEPIVGHGPIVMNTQQEIRQAITDFNSGKFGRMTR